MDSQLAVLADGIQRIGGGFSAMGPYARQKLGTRPGSVSLTQRLTALVAGVTALEAELAVMRPDFIAEARRSGKYTPLTYRAGVTA